MIRGRCWTGAALAALLLLSATLVRAQEDATTAPGEGVWATYDFVPGATVLFATDYEEVPIGRFPADQLEYVRGSAQVVEKEGQRVLEFTDDTRFRVTLPDPLPDDFTLELDARTAAPNRRINVYFAPQEGSIGRYEHQYLSVWRNAGIELKGQSVSSTDSYSEISEGLVPVRLRAEGPYVIVYLDALRAANVPVARIPRTSTIDFEVAASRSQPAYLGKIVIASGAAGPEALAETGAFTTRGIAFAEGGDALLPVSTVALEQIRQALEDAPDLTVEVEDHTVEDAELSRARAESVVAYLVEHGISADRMIGVGRGSSEPVADAATPAGRVESRRVVIRAVAD